ncbi:MAG: hypothetical protein JST85_18335 [Acidobacteria bacterium]|nr:hypothetical protein [Acidobacteriota bacterium]
MRQYELRIEGLRGDVATRLTVATSGFKHSAVLFLAAAPVLPSPLRIENLPQIRDVTGMVDCLQHLGCRIENENRSLTIDNQEVTGYELPARLTQNLHGPLYLLPTMLSRVGRARVGPLGGCRIGEPSADGKRPTVHVLEVLRRFGALAEEEPDGALSVSLPGRHLTGTTIDVQQWSTAPNHVRGPLVSGVTKTAILAALGVKKGRTTILNPYLRAETRELLKACIEAGWVVEQGPQCISIEASQGGSVQMAPIHLLSDFIEIMTYVTLAVLTNRTAAISVTPSTDVELVLAPELSVLRAMGVEIVNDAQTLLVTPHPPHRPFELEAGLPGIYSDNQPFFTLMASTCQGTSIIRDRVWRNRFGYVEGLRALGVNINSSEDGTQVTVRPGSLRSGDAVVVGHDLRAAAVLAIAAAARPGVTILQGAETLERGYEDMPGRLRRCGVGVTVLTGGDA